MAALGTRAAAGDTGYRISRFPIARGGGGPAAWTSPGPKGDRLRRGREHSNRIPMAEDRSDRLPALAADLVRVPVAAIVVAGPPSTFAAKAATTTIPIVFEVGNDPVQLGLATSLSRPGGNMTGINVFNSELAAKRLELLRDLLPRAARIAVLVNPADVTITETQLKEVTAAA